MTTAAAALTVAIGVLRAAGVPDPAQDARALLAHALGIDAGRLTLILPDLLPDGAGAAFQRLIARRARREPVSHLTGYRQFWGRRFDISAAVLDPRPETEVLIAAALSVPFARVLDLGTGSGCLLLSLLADRPDALGVGCDISLQALDVAAANADRLGLSARASLIASDWYARVPGRFDLIVANPPYIAADEMPSLSPEVRLFEPRLALTDGADGLTAYRAITAGALAHLTPGGRLMVEIGPTQGRAVVALMAAAGLQRIDILPDLDGRDRVVVADCPEFALQARKTPVT